MSDTVISAILLGAFVLWVAPHIWNWLGKGPGNGRGRHGGGRGPYGGH